MKSLALTALGLPLLIACAASAPEPTDPSGVDGDRPSAERAPDAAGRFAQAPARERAHGGRARSAPAATPGSAAGDAAGEAYVPGRGEGAAPEAGRALRPHEARPGLATHWGETRHSPTQSVHFERHDPTEPLDVAALHYDDLDGVVAMAGSYPRTHSVLPMAGGAVVVTLEDASGRALPAARHQDRLVAVGSPGHRYQIRVANRTARRFEVVASVDGLDVIDGGDGSFDKRGYLLGAWASVEIDGFRQSGDAVAAFRFGDVEGSYAAARGRGRDVGIIGVAVFGERHDEPSYDPIVERHLLRGPHETHLRETADPFPGRFAPPPGPSLVR